MNETKRPALLVGLIITTFEVLLFIISYLSSGNKTPLDTVIFIVFVVIFIINVKSFYTVNLSAKEFKKKRYLPWISFVLVTLYLCYYLAVVLINSKEGMDFEATIEFGNLIVLALGTLLYLPGILTRVIDNKITYEEHLNQTKTEE